MQQRGGWRNEELKPFVEETGSRLACAGSVLTIALPVREFAAVAGGGVLAWDCPA
jgi:hypothetical protein